MKLINERPKAEAAARKLSKLAAGVSRSTGAFTSIKSILLQHVISSMTAFRL
jgi:hypothetical protein